MGSGAGATAPDGGATLEIRSIAVAVSQSDTTPPAFTDVVPADRAVLTALPLNLSFTATDPSGIRQVGYMLVGGCGVSCTSGNAGPNDALYIFNQQICGLNVGEDRIVLQARDAAWNAVYDTITVTYQPN
jgi:hypothetical protein